MEDAPEADQGKRQIMDMKFIRVKVKTVRITEEKLLHSLIEDGFKLTVDVPLPDVYQKQMSNQSAKLSNYEVLSFNEFAFNSLSLYNFRVDEQTLGKFVDSSLKIQIQDKKVEGSLKMNKLLLSDDFKLSATLDLTQTITSIKQVKKHEGKKAVAVEETEQLDCGTVTVELNLQSGDTEDEMKRNYQIKM